MDVVIISLPVAREALTPKKHAPFELFGCHVGGS
jgi:hypothetical protein